jgi:hypothetical protein
MPGRNTWLYFEVWSASLSGIVSHLRTLGAQGEAKASERSPGIRKDGTDGGVNPKSGTFLKPERLPRIEVVCATERSGRRMIVEPTIPAVRELRGAR